MKGLTGGTGATGPRNDEQNQPETYPPCEGPVG